MNPEDQHCAREAGNTSSTESASAPRHSSIFQERRPQLMKVDPQLLRHWTRRDLLLFGMGAIGAVAVGGSLLPRTTLERLDIIHENKDWPRKEWLLNKSLRIDDDVAEALYSRDRLVPTYTKSQITPFKNNYNGATPNPSYIPGWRLTLDGLASGLSVSLNIRDLLASFRCMSKSRGWCASKVGALLLGGPGFGLMTCYVLTRQCPRRNGPDWNHRSTSVAGEIPTHTSCRSTC